MGRGVIFFLFIAKMTLGDKIRNGVLYFPLFFYSLFGLSFFIFSSYFMRGETQFYGFSILLLFILLDISGLEVNYLFLFTFSRQRDIAKKRGLSLSPFFRDHSVTVASLINLRAGWLSS